MGIRESTPPVMEKARGQRPRAGDSMTDPLSYGVKSTRPSNSSLEWHLLHSERWNSS